MPTESSTTTRARPGAVIPHRSGRGGGEVEGGGEQGAGIGGLRVGEDRVGLAFLDHLAVLHHDHAVASARTTLRSWLINSRRGRAGLQVAQQGDDLGLDRHVEGRGRLVEDDEARVERHGPGDGDALALAAGEFVRVAVHGGGVEPDIGQRPATVARRSAGAAGTALDQQALLDDLATESRGESEP